MQSRPTILIDARRGGRRCDNKCNEPFCAIESPPQEVVFARAALEETGKGAELATFEAVRILGKERRRSEEHTSELQSLMRNSYAVFCLKKKIKITQKDDTPN